MAILPLGAIELHGPRLTMSVDRDLIRAVLDRALALLSRGLTVLALPDQAIGKGTEPMAWPGSLSLSAETLPCVLHDIATSVARAGVGRPIILNGHGGIRAVLELAVRGIRARNGLATAPLDTSAMRPGWLMADLNPEGAIGNALGSTPAKGEALLSTAAANPARLIGDFAGFHHGQVLRFLIPNPPVPGRSAARADALGRGQATGSCAAFASSATTVQQA